MTVKFDISLPSPNYFSGYFVPRHIVLHGTATPPGTARAVANYFTNPGAQVAAHFIIETDGYIFCSVNPYASRGAWANGVVTTWNRGNARLATTIANGINLNRQTISIEHVAATDAMVAGGNMPLAQLAASQALVLQLARDFAIPLTREGIIGHWEIDLVNRKFCPGVINLDEYVRRIAKAVNSIIVNNCTIKGEMLRYYNTLPNPTLTLGLPLTEEIPQGGGKIIQAFERQVLVFDAALFPSEWCVQGMDLGRQWLAGSPYANNSPARAV